MGKEGPCFHCGTDSTPLWRNGPPEKPVLCNACGSRHRLGKSLQNYIPKHGLTMKDTRIAIPQTPHNEAPLKTQENVSNNIYYSAGNSEDNKSNNSRSDSGSPSLQINQENGTENSGSKKTKLWIPHVPSRKRSSVTYHRLSTIEQLQRDLYNVLIYQGPSILSESADDILLYNVKNNLIASTEIGLGSTLFIPPATSTEQEVGPQLQLPEEWRSD